MGPVTTMKLCGGGCTFIVLLLNCTVSARLVRPAEVRLCARGALAIRESVLINFENDLVVDPDQAVISKALH